MLKYFRKGRHRGKYEPRDDWATRLGRTIWGYHMKDGEPVYGPMTMTAPEMSRLAVLPPMDGVMAIPPCGCDACE